MVAVNHKPTRLRSRLNVDLASQGLRAAIYARKSTAQEDRDPDNKSVVTQVKEAREFIQKQGWSLAEEHIFQDDGISGAEFENRPEFLRLLASLPKKGKPPFDVVVMRDPTRLGRDARRNGYFLADILDSQV